MWRGDCNLPFLNVFRKISMVSIEEVKKAMSVRTENQAIEHRRHLGFVLVPWEEFDRIRPLLEAEKTRSIGIPRAVVETRVLYDVSIVKAGVKNSG